MSNKSEQEDTDNVSKQIDDNDMNSKQVDIVNNMNSKYKDNNNKYINTITSEMSMKSEILTNKNQNMS